MYCYFPKTIKNPRYRYSDIPSDQPKPFDYYVTVGCGLCPQCLKRKGNDWKIRLFHEIKDCLSHRTYDRDGYITSGHAEFITLTFSDEYYEFFVDDPSRALRLFLERYRKKYKVSVKHWFITELGSERGRLHFHGILFNSKFHVKKHTFDRVQNPYTKKWHFTSNDGLIKQYNKELQELWKYGGTFVGFADESSISYIVKYMTKRYVDDKDGTKECFNDIYRQRIFASNGLGVSYVDSPSASYHIKDDGKTLVRTIVFDGWKYTLPRYYQLKIFGDDLMRDDQFRRFLDDPPPNLYFDGHTYDSYDSLQAELASRAHEFTQRRLFPFKVLKHFASELSCSSFSFDDFVRVIERYGQAYARSWFNKFIKPFDNPLLKQKIYEHYSIA